MAAQPTMGVVLWQERTPQKWTAPGPIWPGEVQLAYAIGLADPVSVSVNTFGTGMIRDETLAIWLEDHVDMRPGVVIRRFGLTRPIYRGLAAYGPFGENGRGMPWERTDLRFPAQF